MDDALLKSIFDTIPPHNKHLSEGIVHSQLKVVEKYFELVFKCAEKSWPEELKWGGCVKCTPEETFREIADNNKNNRRTGKMKLELAPTDAFLVKYRLIWKETTFIDRYMYMPAPNEVGQMRLRGPMHTISPVLADVAFSVDKNGLYIPFTRDKITSQRSPYPIKEDGKIVSTYVTWSLIHKEAKKKGPKGGILSSLGHYLFARYGVYETFKLFGKTNVVLGTDLNTDNYPTSDWVIYESVKVPPRTTRRRDYIPTNIKVAVPRKDNTEFNRALVAAFYYVTDYFPDRVKVDYCDNPDFWKILLGRVIYSKEDNEGKLAVNMKAHFDSLNVYVDDLVTSMLSSIGFECKDIYQFMAYVIENISRIMLNADPASTYGKKLLVLRYVMFDIVSAIFFFTYLLRGNGKKPLDEKNIKHAIGKHLRPDLIFKLSSGHGEVQVISSPNDNAIYSYLSNIALQADASKQKTKKKGKGNLNDPSKRLHACIAEFGSMLYLPKSETSGKKNLNMFANVQADGTMLRDPNQIEFFDAVQREIET